MVQFFLAFAENSDIVCYSKNIQKKEKNDTETNGTFPPIKREQI